MRQFVTGMSPPLPHRLDSIIEVVSRPGNPVAVEVAEQLDYYLVFPSSRAVERGLSPEGLVVEEFELRPDGTTAGLNSAGWTKAGGSWWTAAAFSRTLRADARLRAKVAPVGRTVAQSAYRELSGVDLPTEPQLRRHFLDGLELPASASFVPVQATADQRLYRLLLAGELTEHGLASLRGGWRMPPFDRAGDAAQGVAGRTRRTVDGRLVSWTLRRVDGDAAWAVDLSVDWVDSTPAHTEPLLSRLRAEARRHGLIPVTVARLR
ncbi:hypothetical protein [Catellatospora tritici]|uniref:hypothetical protein n=1 Tax=Catellatospora tritici TaxID=2851566 RepID=UPI001C2D6B36|nr:hypothetical protein [Catellatospora tritici]MBV1856483.1 hypothetical protein [Catellatospora tritici]